jgi:hypothetical protein
MQGVVKNFMIGPVFGFNKDGTQSEKPNGVIQFINKKDNEKIGEDDERRFDEINSLLGMCIDSTKDIAKTIEVTLGVNKHMKVIGQIMNKEVKNNDSAPTGEILDSLQNHINEIKVNYAKLIENRQKAQGKI